jgi:hypothetical protein
MYLGESLSRRERLPIKKWAAGEGYKMKKHLWYPSPGPLPRATLSRRERDSPVRLRWIAR